MKILRKLLITAALLAMTVCTQASTTRITFLHSDATGSPVAATNEAGAVIWRKTYAPYGKASNKDGDNRIGYTGHVEDQNGLIYAGARYYDPTLGRFLSDDPVRFSESNPMSFNRFAYANNNPYRFTDPNGKWSTEAHNELIDRAFSSLNSSQRSAMKKGSARVDSYFLGNQRPENSFMHAMSSSILSKSEAEEKMNAFVNYHLNLYRKNMESAKSYDAAGDSGRAAIFERDAYFSLGEALHPVMDSTSPAHSGFKEWHETNFNEHGNFPGSLESKDELLSHPDILNDTIEKMKDSVRGS